MNGWWEVFWFFLPAGIANMSPVLAARLPLLRHWNTPLDLGHSWRGARLFGDNKTWRGLIFGTVTAIIVGLIQYRGLGVLPASNFFIIGAAGAMGLGALLGDALESFFKRRRGIRSGDSWLPFDQLDYITGGIVLVWPFVRLSFEQIIMLFVLYFFLHVIASYIGFLLGFKRKPI